MKTRLIGLTGLRGAGKSTVAAMLAEAGYVRAHTFAAGKAMCEAYFRFCGATVQQAHDMAHGDLRDVPSEVLPDKASPRLMMEHLGRFMGQDMGTDWTFGAALKNAGDQPLVFESIVYEVEALRAAGGQVWRIDRPGHTGPQGLHTDAAVGAITPDRVIVNDGDLSDLRRKVQAFFDCPPV